MMKNVFMIILFIFASKSINAQVDIVGGMGISFVYAPSLIDYVDLRTPGDEIPAFSSTAEFYGEVDYSISDKYQLGLEYVYTLFDFSSTYAGNYTLSYAHHKPSILAYYVISGEGYKFKFGAGAGLRIVNLTENIYVDENLDAFGFGLLARVQGHTKLSDNVYANIGSTLRTDFPGTPSHDNIEFHDNTNLNSFSVSVNLGISYFF
ncbi:MAG: hypothetical protein PF445_03815 [Melioribacteraceae bacterium]|jgi:hypothetical protein|nr:hypothetical protein [Melioribacteraceae bacterium]